MKTMRLSVLVCMGVLAMFCLAGCESEDKGDPVTITGDSKLLVDNNTGDDFDIYFDGQYIGDVGDNKERRWSVPSGTHKVRAKAGGNDLDETFIFYAGKETTVTIVNKGPFGL